MTADPTPLLRHQATSPRLPGWLRIALWCWSHANHRGHARAWPSQLREELMFTSSQDVSRAIDLARQRGLVDPTSTARCVVLPGQGHHACESSHRETA